MSKTRKVVKIKDTSNSMAEGTKEFQKFNSNLFKHDYQEMIQKILPQYHIEFNLVDDENWYAYPDITGDITDEERDEIINAMESDPLFLSFANDKYFTNISEEMSHLKNGK